MEAYWYLIIGLVALIAVLMIKDFSRRNAKRQSKVLFPTGESQYLDSHPYPEAGSLEKQANWILQWALDCADDRSGAPGARGDEASEWVKEKISQGNYTQVVGNFYEHYCDAREKFLKAKNSNSPFARTHVRYLYESYQDLFNRGRFLDL